MPAGVSVMVMPEPELEPPPELEPDVPVPDVGWEDTGELLTGVEGFVGDGEYHGEDTGELLTGVEVCVVVVGELLTGVEVCVVVVGELLTGVEGFVGDGEYHGEDTGEYHGEDTGEYHGEDTGEYHGEDTGAWLALIVELIGLAPALGVDGEAAGELRAGAEGCVVFMGEDFGALKPTSWPCWL